MLAENGRRSLALVRRVRRRDDYGTLLLAGEVRRPISEIEDPARWRTDLCAQAHRDRLWIITGQTETGVYAALNVRRGEPSPIGFGPDTEQWLHTARPAYLSAGNLGHHWLLIRDGQEGVVMCRDCDAIGYINAEHHVVDGDLFEVPCFHTPPLP